MANAFPNARKQNVLNEFKLRFTCPPLENAVVRYDRKQEPTMSISIVDNQPRLTVYTNVEGDRDNGRIEGNMDTYTFYAFLEALKMVADDEEFKGAITIDNLGYFFGASGKSDKPGVKSQTVIGRDSDGCVFVSLISGKRPKAKFVLNPSEWHSWSRNGEKLSRSEMSSIYAKGQVNVISKLVARVLGDEFISYQDIKARKDANRANRGNGNGGGQGGNGGGYNKPAPKPAAENNDFDNDIPW